MKVLFLTLKIKIAIEIRKGQGVTKIDNDVLFMEWCERSSVSLTVNFGCHQPLLKPFQENNLFQSSNPSMAAKPLSTAASSAYSNGRIKVASIVFLIIILMFIRCITFSLKPSVRPLVLGIHIIDSAKQILRCSLHRSHQYSSRHFSKISHEKSVMF